MRAIIISDKDARALLDQLKLCSLEGNLPFAGGLIEKLGASESDVRALVEQVHRSFHYHVTRWLQEQGAEVVR